MSKAYRIGVATTDGIVVNEHFGRAGRFLILDVDEDGKTSVAEERSVTPVCQGGNHDDDRMEENVQRLSDCRYLLVSRIGQGAADVLEQHGISAYELPGILEESVQKLQSYLEIQSMLYGEA